MKNRLILWSALLLTGFLAGFIPQYLKTKRCINEVSIVRQQFAGCQTSAQLSQLRDQAAMMYLEATRKNYGTAADESRVFFDAVQRVVAQTSDPIVRKALAEVLQSRDQVTAALANGDAGVVDDLRQVVLTLENNTRR
jgi:hypothetical protein